MSFFKLPYETAGKYAPVDTVGDLPADAPDGSVRYVKDVDTVYTMKNGSWAAVSGDTTGAASSTDNAIARFNGTGGKSIQNSGVTIDDSNNISTTGSVSAGSFSTTGNITVGGTVDGRDVADDGSTLDSHTAASSAHGVTGDVVGTSDTQTLTGKTIDANSNTISNLAHGAEVDDPSSGVHGVTGSVVGTTDTQDISNKTVTDALTFDEISNPTAPSTNEAQLYAVDVNGRSSFRYQDTDGFVGDIVQDNTFIAKNETGSSISKGQAVYVSAASGGFPKIDLADASDPTKMPCAGIAAEDIANNAFGHIMTVGLIENFNTSSFSVSDQLYVSASTPGAITATRPTHPNLNQLIGFVLTQSVGNGDVQVNVSSIEGDELGTRENTFSIGDDAAGAKTVAFKNGSTLSLQATPTDARTVTIPDATDTLVGRATTDTLINKTIDADNNTISNLAHGAEVDNPSSGVHGVTGDVVGTSDTQTLTGKTIDASNNTLSNIANAAIAAAAEIAYSKLDLSGSVVNADINSSAAIAVSKLAAGSSNSVLTSNGTTNSFSGTPTVTTLTANIATAGTGNDSIVVQNSSAGSVGDTIGIQYKFGSAVPSAIRTRMTNVGTGEGAISFLVSTDGTEGNLTEMASLDESRLTLTKALKFTSAATTIASGAITKTSSFMVIDTEGGASTDDLTTINGGSTGDILILKSTNNARDITLKDGTGNLSLAGDFTLSNSTDTITLIFGGSDWLEICRSDNGV